MCWDCNAQCLVLWQLRVFPLLAQNRKSTPSIVSSFSGPSCMEPEGSGKCQCREVASASGHVIAGLEKVYSPGPLTPQMLRQEVPAHWNSADQEPQLKQLLEKERGGVESRHLIVISNIALLKSGYLSNQEVPKRQWVDRHQLKRSVISTSKLLVELDEVLIGILCPVSCSTL